MLGVYVFFGGGGIFQRGGWGLGRVFSENFPLEIDLKYTVKGK